MSGNLPRRTYLRAAVESPIVLAGIGLALVVGVALGAKAGIRRWVDFIAPVEEDWDDTCWCGCATDFGDDDEDEYDEEDDAA